MSDVDEVSATLYFYDHKLDDAPLHSKLYNDGSGKPLSNYALEPHMINVENIREKMNLFHIDTSGFQFFDHEFQDLDFDDDAAVEAEYFPEVVNVVQEITGASKIVIFEHLVRRHRRGSFEATSKSQPAKGFPHIDQTTTSAVARVYRHLPAEEAHQRLQKRFQIINFWRPILNPALDCPLTVCDYRSLNQETDLVPVSLLHRDGKGEFFILKYNPAQRWKYVKAMRPDEFVLFKCFDSSQERETALMVPHAAFEDPSTPEGAPLRESVEVRMLVFYE